MKKLISLSVLCLLLLNLVGCSKQNTENELSVAIVPWIGFAPLYVAQEQGYFDELNLDVDIQVITDIGTVKSAIQSDKLDISWGTGDMMPIFADSGLNLKAFYAIDWSNGGDGVVASEDYQDWSDFEGVEFAAQEGFPPGNLFLYALEENGVDLSKVSIKEMDTSTAASAFKAGQVDVAALYQPYLSAASEREGSSIFISSADYPYVITDYLSAKPEVLEGKREQIKGLVEALDKAISFINSEKELAAEISAPFFGLEKQEALDIFGDVVFPSLKENQELFNSEKINDTFSTFSNAMQKAGIIEKEVKPSDLFTTEIIN